jgi:hypothetical protein
MVTVLGDLTCATSNSSLPIDALAVDRAGGLYAANLDGVFRIDATRTGFACRQTNLVISTPDSGFLQPLGIAFVGEPDGGEELFGSFFAVIPTSPPVRHTPLGIVSVDAGPTDLVGDALAQGGLTGTGDGRLYVAAGLEISQVDPSTQSIVQTFSPAVQPQLLLQFSQTPVAFWANDFFLFPRAVVPTDGGVDSSRSIIVRFEPSDGGSQSVAQVDGLVFGAGVSTCAPLR